MAGRYPQSMFSVDFIFYIRHTVSIQTKGCEAALCSLAAVPKVTMAYMKRYELCIRFDIQHPLKKILLTGTSFVV